MSRRDGRTQTPSGCRVKSNVGCKNCRLTELSILQRFFGTVRLQCQEIVIQQGGGTLENLTRRRGMCRCVAAHSDALRTLSRKDDAHSHAAHLQATAPHESPPPNATKTMMSPGFTIPARTVSESAIGMEAADVFPYSAILMTTFSSGSSR